MEITLDQIESCDADVRQRFFTRLLGKLATMPDTSAEDRSQFAQMAVTLAENLGMSRASSIGGYVLLSARLGAAFNDHAEIWRVLSDERMAANLRLSFLPDLVSAKVWEEIKSGAGEIAQATIDESGEFGEGVISAVEGGQYEVGEMGGLSADAALVTMRVCELHNVRVVFRPVDDHASDLLEDGCHPVPGNIKLKAVNPLDVLLGAREADRAKIWFPTNMKAKAEIAQIYTELRVTNPEQAQKLASRYKMRAEELSKYSGWMQRMVEGGGVLLDEHGILLNAQTGNAYTWERDVFDIQGVDGSSLSDEHMHNAVLAELRKPPISFHHGDLKHWDVSDSAECERYKQGVIDKHHARGSLEVFSSEGAMRTTAPVTDGEGY